MNDYHSLYICSKCPIAFNIRIGCAESPSVNKRARGRFKSRIEKSIKMQTENLNERVNEAFDIAVYLQFMGAFAPDLGFNEMRRITESTYSFFKDNDESVVEIQLPTIKNNLQSIADLVLKRYPVKQPIPVIAKEWNELFRTKQDVLGFGVTYGWLSNLVEIHSIVQYTDYVPYHFKIGLGANKGYFGIEEEFLLRDAFNVLIKAEHYFDLLQRYGQKIAMEREEMGQRHPGKEEYTKITDLKFEVAACCRLTTVSFYAFLECFVNSLGFSFLQYNQDKLSAEDKELLMGMKNGNFLQLKSKIERFQRIMRTDRQAILVLTDPKQCPPQFAELFDQYNSLRNAAMHYAPGKEEIWLRPADWMKKADNFSRLAMQLSLKIWNACMEKTEGPQYLGKLNYAYLKNAAKVRFEHISFIQNQLFVAQDK